MQKAEFYLNPSKRLKYYLCCLYSLALGLLMCLPLYWLLKLLGALISTLYFLHIVHLHADRKALKSIRSVFQTEKGRWGYETNAQKCYLGQILTSFKNSYLIILRLRLINQSVSIVIPADALQESEFRTLSMRLDSP